MIIHPTFYICYSSTFGHTGSSSWFDFTTARLLHSSSFIAMFLHYYHTLLTQFQILTIQLFINNFDTTGLSNSSFQCCLTVAAFVFQKLQNYFIVFTLITLFTLFIPQIHQTFYTVLTFITHFTFVIPQVHY